TPASSSSPPQSGQPHGASTTTVSSTCSGGCRCPCCPCFSPLFRPGRLGAAFGSPCENGADCRWPPGATPPTSLPGRSAAAPPAPWRVPAGSVVRPGAQARVLIEHAAPRAALIVGGHGWIVGWDVAPRRSNRRQAGYSMPPAARTLSPLSAPTAARTAMVPVMDASELPRAVAACRAVAAACGLRVDDAVVLNDSNRLAVRLGPCDVRARVAPRSRQSGAEFEVELARRLADSGAPLATLDPRVEPRVYEQGGFAVTLWTYYEPQLPHAVAPAEYAS